MNSNELKHYGVLGMKWGVRRTQAELDAAAGRTPRKSRRQVKNELSTMSDAELRTRLNRLNMEKQYQKLSRPEKTTGRKIVDAILIESAKTVASSYVKTHLQEHFDPLVGIEETKGAKRYRRG